MDNIKLISNTSNFIKSPLKVVFKKVNFKIENYKNIFEKVKRIINSGDFTNEETYAKLYRDVYSLSNSDLEAVKTLIDEIVFFSKTHIVNLIANILPKNKNVSDNSDDVHSSLLVNNFISLYKKCDELIEKLKKILTNNITRFNKDLMFKINSLNLKNFLLDFLSTSEGSEILNKIQEFVTSQNIFTLEKESSQFNEININITPPTNNANNQIESKQINPNINHNLKTNSVLHTIKFIKSIGAKSLLLEIISIEREKIIINYKEKLETEFNKLISQYKNEKLENSTQNKNNENSISVNNYNNSQISNSDLKFKDSLSYYLKYFNDSIQNICFQFGTYFGLTSSSSLLNSLNKILFSDKLISILSNSPQMFFNLILSRDFSILNLIYSLLNRHLDSLKIFIDSFFTFYIEKFNSDLKVPNSIREGLTYIDFLIDRISILNETFDKSFNKDHKIQLKYKETLLRMTNNKNVKNLSMLCGVYINEVMSRNVNNINSIKSSLDSEAFHTILQAIEDKENFFLTVSKFLIKRVSNFKFVKSNEESLIKILRNVFGTRHLFPIYRIINDLEKSREMFNEGVNLFSFNAINRNDLGQVIGTLPSPIGESLDNVREKYKEKYSHRIVDFSQMLSTVILCFNKKEEVLVNFIQFGVISAVDKLNRNEDNKGNNLITFEDVIKLLNVKKMPSFRQHVISLINAGIILVNKSNGDNFNSNVDFSNSDYVKMNCNFTCGEKTFWNLTNISTASNEKKSHLGNLGSNYSDLKGKDELGLSRDHTSQSDIHALENSMESQIAIYNQNKIYIVDSRIVKLIKSGICEHSVLLKTLFKEFRGFFGNENNNPDVNMIGKRIDALIERNLIVRKIEENIITYSL